MFVRVQTFNIQDDESLEEAFNNPVCLQGRVVPRVVPCSEFQKCWFKHDVVTGTD